MYKEYRGFVPKVNGQFAVSEVAFETLVNWTKFKSVENKKSVPIVERGWYFNNYRRERSNMEKMIGRVSLSKYIKSLQANPKFDFEMPFNCRSGVPNTISLVSSSSECSNESNSGSGNTTNNTINVTNVILNNYTELKLIVDGKSGSPVAGQNTYQNNALIGATGIGMINVNKNTEYKGDDYSFNGVSGTITRISQWQTADVSVI